MAEQTQEEKRWAHLITKGDDAIKAGKNAPKGAQDAGQTASPPADQVKTGEQFEALQGRVAELERKLDLGVQLTQLVQLFRHRMEGYEQTIAELRATIRERGALIDQQKVQIDRLNRALELAQQSAKPVTQGSPLPPPPDADSGTQPASQRGQQPTQPDASTLAKRPVPSTYRPRHQQGGSQ